MAKKRKKKELFGDFGFTNRNYLLFGLGVFLIIVGYLFMIIGGRDGFLALVISPIVLLASYLIIIPAAIMTGKDSGQKKG